MYKNITRTILFILFMTATLVSCGKGIEIDNKKAQEDNVVSKPNTLEDNVVSKPNTLEDNVVSKPNILEDNVVSKPNTLEDNVVSKSNALEDTSIELSNPFDINIAKTGDTVCGMEIIEIEDEYWIKFSGEVTISGSFIHEDEESYHGEIVLFIPDDYSVSKIPKLSDDERNVWFVFSNTEDIAKEFGKPRSEGKATVVIGDYYIDACPTETYNEAKLVRIIEKEIVEM